MWRCAAGKARDLSLLSSKRVQVVSQSLGNLLITGTNDCSAESAKETCSGLTTLNRSFSSDVQPSRTPPPSSEDATTQSTVPRLYNRRINSQRTISKKKNQSNLKATKNQSPTATLLRLSQRLSELDPLPPVWEAHSTVTSVKEREAIFLEAQMLLERIETAVRSGILNPSGKHGRELSHLLGKIMEIYSQTVVATETDCSVFDACCRVMTLLQEWNLNIHARDYACAVQAGARESRWKEASYLFREQIDPDAHGHAPMEISRQLTTGLYAIARNSQEEGGATVDHVMDAVLRMSMVNPTDQDEYVLSAGLTLGHAGEGEAFANYLSNSYNSSRLGQALTAAVMNACALSSRPDVALQMLEELVADPLRGGNEWQYGGEYNAMNPLCRDVAMRVLGHSASGNVSDLALELYQQVMNDEYQISVDALCGVIRACECDGKWQEAVEVLTDLLDRYRQPHWLVDGNDCTSVVAVEEAREKHGTDSSGSILNRCRSQIGSMLSSVMRSCNAQGKFGVAILCCCFVGNTLMEFAVNETEPLSLMVLSRFGNQEDLLVSSMVSLSGLGCHRDAKQVYVDSLESFPMQAWYDAQSCYKYLQSTHSSSDAVLPVPWDSAYRHIRLLMSACNMIEATKQESSTEDIQLLASALSKAMRACTAAGQPESGLLLAKRIEGVIAATGDTEQSFSFGSAVASFFGYDSSRSEKDLLLSDTSVLAETVSAYRAMKKPEEGLALLEKIPDSIGSSRSARSTARDPSSDAHWIPVINQAMYLLTDQNRMDDAHTLFKATNERMRDQETLLAMATAFEKQKLWKEIVKLYYGALNHGLLSEALGILAMKAVIETTGEGQAKLLRLIAKRLSELYSLKESQWLATRYWHLERALGWNPARLLMWWSDPETSNEMKLQFAIEFVAKRQKTGLTPKNDALRYIVNSVRQYDQPTELMPLSQSQWLDLLRSILAEAEESSLWTGPSFVESAAVSLFWLGGNEEGVDLVRDAIARGVRVTNTTAAEVARVAQADGRELEELSLLSSRVE